MVAPQINYAGQPWTAGATWLTNVIGNQGTQDVTDFINGSGGTLYTGDVVVLGTSTTTPDVQGFNVTSTTTVSSPYVVGVVGGITNMAFAGGAIPEQTPAWRYDSVTTATSVTTTDSSALASDVGKEVIGPGFPSGAFIVSVVAGTSFTTNVATTASATVTVAIGPREGAIGPGWLGVPAGEMVPVVQRGWAYVNIGTNTIGAGINLSTSATARVANTAAAAASVAALQALVGTFIAITLEAQNGAGVITSGDGSASKLVRCWVDKM